MITPDKSLQESLHKAFEKKFKRKAGLGDWFEQGKNRTPYTYLYEPNTIENAPRPRNKYWYDATIQKPWDERIADTIQEIEQEIQEEPDTDTNHAVNMALLLAVAVIEKHCTTTTPDQIVQSLREAKRAEAYVEE